MVDRVGEEEVVGEGIGQTDLLLELLPSHL